MVLPDNGIVFSAKTKWDFKPPKTRGSVKCILLKERSQSQEAIEYVIPSDILEKAKLWKQWKEYWFPGVWVEKNA